MHEEATSMSSVPSSVAVSTSHNQNGTATSVTVPVTDVDLDSIPRENSVSDNVDLQVSYSSNSAGIKKTYVIVSICLQVILPLHTYNIPVPTLIYYIGCIPMRNLFESYLHREFDVSFLSTKKTHFHYVIVTVRKVNLKAVAGKRVIV